ncbi:MAG: DUF1697 domain-containing protein [Actinomycetota bacterium]|nr:MAG: DUF1697 domain-containing protein [Actinomycetota bacterium]
MRYAVLLRAVNVGGTGKLPMSDLREVLTGLGYDEVSTYLQSGNALLSADATTPAAIRARVEQALAARSARVDVLVRTHADLARIVEDNPYPDAAATPTRLWVGFLASTPSAQAVETVQTTDWGEDRITVTADGAYLTLPGGGGRSKLAAVALARLGVLGTMRNWNTVLALRDRTATP